MEAIVKFKPSEKSKVLKLFLGTKQNMTKPPPKLSEQTDQLRNLLKTNGPWKWGSEQEAAFDRIKQMLTGSASTQNC